MKRFFLILTSLLFISSVYSQDALTEDISALIKKGNKVFIETDKESISGRYLMKQFNKWKYWTVTEDVQEAQFVIAITIKFSDKFAHDPVGKAILAEASADFKTSEGQVFKTSPTIEGTANAFNGYNSYKRAAANLMSKYFKKEFKK